MQMFSSSPEKCLYATLWNLEVVFCENSNVGNPKECKGRKFSIFMIMITIVPFTKVNTLWL